MFKKIIQAVVNLFAWLKKNKPLIDVVIGDKTDTSKKAVK
jgi:hypothetical protein